MVVKLIREGLEAFCRRDTMGRVKNPEPVGDPFIITDNTYHDEVTRRASSLKMEGMQVGYYLGLPKRFGGELVWAAQLYRFPEKVACSVQKG